MKKNVLFLAMAGKAMVIAVLALGLVLIGCDSGGGGDTPNGGTAQFDGTWVKGNFKVIISGSGYTIQAYDSNFQKGTFSYNDTTVSFTGTHDWAGSWVAGTYTPSTYAYSISGNTLTFSLVSEPNEFDAQFVGNWTKQ